MLMMVERYIQYIYTLTGIGAQIMQLKIFLEFYAQSLESVVIVVCC